MDINNNLPDDKINCLLCGARLVDCACPNECNIPTMELDNGEEE